MDSVIISNKHKRIYINIGMKKQKYEGGAQIQKACIKLIKN